MSLKNKYAILAEKKPEPTNGEIMNFLQHLSDVFETGLDGITSMIKGLQEQVTDLKKENGDLKNENEMLKTRIETVEEGLDWQEQRYRNHAIRVFDVKVDSKVEKDKGNVTACMETVHASLGKVKSLISEKLNISMVKASDYIKMAHKLPGKSSAPNMTSDPIYVVFTTTQVRNEILSAKRVHKCPMSADLTQKRRALLKKLIESKKFFKAWHLDGKIIKYMRSEKDKPKVIPFSAAKVHELLNST